MKHRLLAMIVLLSVLTAACSSTSPDTPSDTEDASTPVSLPSPLPETVTPPVSALPPDTLSSEPTSKPASLWRALPNIPTAHYHYQGTALVIDGQIYVIAGYDRFRQPSTLFSRFDPVSGEWQTLASLPAPRDHVMAAVYEGQIYFFGGLEGTRTNAESWRYDPAADEWTALADLPAPRSAGSAVTIGDTIYIVGGSSPVSSKAVIAYDPAANTYQTLAEMREPRDHVPAVVYNDEIWIVGGRWTAVDIDTVEIFNPETGEWRRGPSLSQARSGHGLAVVDDKIYAIGGEIMVLANNGRALDSVEVYDPALDEWVAGPELPSILQSFQTAVVDGTIYIFGGSRVPLLPDGSSRFLTYTP